MLTAEQKIARKQYVTASNGACLFDEHPFKSKFEWWAELVSDEIEPDCYDESEAVDPRELGNHLQSGVLSLYQEKRRRTGDEVFVRENVAQTLTTCKRYPLLAATLDAEQTVNEVEALADSKVAVGRPYFDRHGNRIVPIDEWREGVPLAYQIQGQIQLMVTGAAFVTFPCLILSEGVLFWHDVYPNERFQARLAEEAERFWNEHVVPRVPPTPTDYAKAVKLLPKLVPERSGSICLEGQNATDLDVSLRDLIARRKSLSGEMDRIEAEIKKCHYDLSEAMGDAAEAVIEETGVTYRLKNVRVDEKQITRRGYQFLRVDVRTPKAEGEAQ